MEARTLVILSALLVVKGMSGTGGEEVRNDQLSHCRYQDWHPYLTDFMVRALICENMTSEKHLDDDLITSVGYGAKCLMIFDSSLRYIMHDSFVGTNIEEIYLMHTELLALSDTDVAFEGLEDHLVRLVAINSSYVSHWNWNHLRNLQRLEEVIVTNSDVTELTLEMTGELKNLTRLTFYNNDLSWIHPEAFAHLQNLQSLKVVDNEVTGLKRSMFPSPANQLTHLNFNFNLLRSLPPDMFENMPKLRDLRLEHNRLHTLDERVFRTVVGSLSRMALDGNPLICDCHIKWIRKFHVTSNYMTGNCTVPSDLAGRPIISVKPQELWC